MTQIKNSGFWSIMRKGICFLLIITLIATVMAETGMAAPAPDNERTFDIGKNFGNVTAELSDDGLLKISGVGDTADYTAETAPFAHKAEEIKAVEIEMGVTSIGDYLLYNLGNIRDCLTLPKSVIHIGEKALSGDDESSAPRPHVIINEFESSEITVENTSEDGENQFSIETIVEQQMDDGVFYPFEDSERFFIASVNNNSFASAAESAGIIRADAIISAAFNVGSGQSSADENMLIDMPVVGGEIVLPVPPYAFTGEAGDAMFEYTFKGWTEARDDADTVREVGSKYQVNGKQDLYFIASWDKKPRIEIDAEVSENTATLSIPSAEGYEISDIQWKMGEMDFSSGEYAWSDISGENGQTLERELQPGDEHREFTADMTVTKEANGGFFGLFASEEVVDEVTMRPVRALGIRLLAAPIASRLTFNAGAADATGINDDVEASPDGEVIVPLCYYTRTGYVFGGWEETGTGTHRDPGEIITISGDTQLTAKWINVNNVNVIYCSNGTLPNIATYRNTFQTAAAGGSIYNNYLVITADAENNFGILHADYPFTLTSRDPKGQNSNPSALFWAGGRYWGEMSMSANLRIENIILNGNQGMEVSNIKINNNTLTIGNNVTSSAPANRPHIYCINADTPDGARPQARLLSGEFTQINGLMSYYEGRTVDPLIVVAGNALVTGNIAASVNNAQTLTGNVEIAVGGNAQVQGAIYGGGNVAEVRGNTRVRIFGGSVGNIFGAGIGKNTTGNSSVEVHGGIISGNVFGGGDQQAGIVGGNASVKISGGTITGRVYGGGNMGAVSGGTSVNISGGNVQNNVFAAGGNAAIGTNSSLAISGGIISGNVFGGGDQAGGVVPGRAQVSITGGDIAGTVYGGGNLANVPATGIDITGGKIGNVFGGGYEGNITGEAYVSAENAEVEGNLYGGGMNGMVGSSYVELGAVNVGGNVYGGGEAATVTTLANPAGGLPVQIVGGSVGGSVYGGGQRGAVNSGSGVSVSGGARVGNIYGGGEDAAVSGVTKVIVTNSEVINEVYGGGKNGTVRSTSVEIVGESSIVGEESGNGNVYGGGEGVTATIGDAASKTSVLIDAATVFGTVFGGGNAAVSPSSEIRVINGATVGEVFGGGYNGAISGATSVSISDSSTLHSVFGGGKEGKVNSTELSIINSSIGTESSEGNVFAGGEGAGAHVDTGTPAVTIKDSTVSGSVYGGGDNGNVQSTMIDIIGNCTINGSVYGGGKGMPENDVLGAVNGNASMHIYNEGGNATVNIGGSVYGGGDNGNVGGDAVVTLETAVITENAYAGGRVGEVTGDTTLNVSGGRVGRNAYGGSLMGPVGGDSELIINGGVVGRNAFGGSKGSSTDLTSGTVAGSSSVSITNGTIGENGFSPSNPEESGNLIAGGEYAPVLVDSSVTVNIGTGGIATSVYGGGFFAPVGTETAGGIATVNIINGLVGARVYGGGYGSERATTRQSRINITGGRIGATVYGGGALGIVNGIGNDSTFISISGGDIGGSVFGAGQGQSAGDSGGAIGGNYGLVKSSTNIDITGGIIRGIVYGGGDFGDVGTGTIAGGMPAPTPNADVSTNVHMTGGTVNIAIFGGGSGAITDDSANGVIFGNTNVLIEKGSIGSAVWGGCNRSYVTGSTTVNLNPTLGNITLNGTIYGGGNIPGGDNPVFRDDVYLILGDTNVYVNGTSGANTMQMTGSIFGGGNLTNVLGTSTVFIENYAGEMESLQRAEHVYVRNSNIRLYGANDVTEAIVRYYSVAVVGELVIANNSTITVDREVRQLSSLTAGTITGNYPLFATPVPHTAETGRNTLRIYQGRILQIRDSSGVFGLVSGVFWLDILSESGSDEFGVTIQAALGSTVSPNGEGASAPNDTGAFIRANTDSSRNLPLESGKTSSYAYWRLGSAASVIDLTIQAVHGDNGGTGLAVQEFELPTSMNVSGYVIEDPIEIEGSYYLVLPEIVSDTVTLPALGSSNEKNKNNTFAMSVEATNGSEANGAWEDTGSVVYFTNEQALNPPAPWTSNAVGVWRYGNIDPSTTGDGQYAGTNGKALFKLYYEPDFRGFVGGKMKVTFKEYEDEIVVNRVLVNLTLEGEESTNKVQTADIAKGEVFREIYNETPPDIEINSLSAVSTFFTTVYYPEAAGASGMNITLLSEVDDEITPVSFPYGTKIILSDMNNSSNMAYYSVVSTQSGSESSISLASFVSLGTGTQAHYPGPTDNTKRITEKILVVLDFSDVASGALLPNGEYSICLRHSMSEDFLQKAGFRIAEDDFALTSSIGASKTDDRRVDVILTRQIPPQETRFDTGTELHVNMLTSAGHQVAIYPTAQFAVDSGVVFINSDGTLTVKTSAQSTRLSIDFSGVSQDNLPGGSYKFKSELLPLGIVAEMDTAISLSDGGGGSGLQDSPQAVRAYVEDNNDRLLDVSEAAAAMSVNIEVGGLEAGDTVMTEVLVKSGATPQTSSYTNVVSAGGWVALSGSGANRTAIVTVPQGQASGTYRLMVKVVNASGTVVAEAPCNFIVK